MSLAQILYRRLLAIQPNPPLSVSGTTTNAVTLVVGTGYVLSDGLAARLDAGFTVTDRTAHKSAVGNASASLRNYAGTYAVAGQTGHVTAGDSTLSSCTVPFSTGGELHVTFTPPSGYVGSLDWEIDISITIL